MSSVDKSIASSNLASNTSANSSSSSLNVMAGAECGARSLVIWVHWLLFRGVTSASKGCTFHLESFLIHFWSALTPACAQLWSPLVISYPLWLRPLQLTIYHICFNWESAQESILRPQWRTSHFLVMQSLTGTCTLRNIQK